MFVYAVEPWLYGRSTGLSAIAIIAAVIFWTWLWGPVGLLLAMPLTVCVAVMGRYIPELGYLNVLLGVEPVLAPEARFYQRLVALDQDEAMDARREQYARARRAGAVRPLVIPRSALAEIDRHKGALDAERERFVFDTTRQIIEEFGDARRRARGASRRRGVCDRAGARRSRRDRGGDAGAPACRARSMRFAGKAPTEHALPAWSASPPCRRTPRATPRHLARRLKRDAIRSSRSWSRCGRARASIGSSRASCPPASTRS